MRTASNSLDRDASALELRLRPVEGIPRWLGGGFSRAIFRMFSMAEQTPSSLAQPMTPNESYFRRDRHRHPTIAPQAFILNITGVARERALDLSTLRALPWEHHVAVMECAGNGNHLMGSAGLVGQARWSGPSLETVLATCGGPGAATHFAFHGLDPIPLIRDGYHYGLSLNELIEAGALLAVEMNGEPLPRARGFPVRLIVPGVYSMSHIKWLGWIEGKTAPHRGIHNRWVFTNKERRDGRWVRVQARKIGLKSLVTRCHRGPAGWILEGFAWGGGDPITRIAVSTDGGKTWIETECQSPATYLESQQKFDPPDLAHAWFPWRYEWKNAAPGRHRIGSRAFSIAGDAQRLHPDPTVRGHFNQTQVKWREVDVP